MTFIHLLLFFSVGTSEVNARKCQICKTPPLPYLSSHRSTGGRGSAISAAAADDNDDEDDDRDGGDAMT